MSEPETTTDPHIQFQIEQLQQQLADASRSFDQVLRELSELKLEVTNLTATVHQRTTNPNCPKCGSMYRGVAKPEGQRPCGACGMTF